MDIQKEDIHYEDNDEHKLTSRKSYKHEPLQLIIFILAEGFFSTNVTGVTVTSIQCTSSAHTKSLAGSLDNLKGPESAYSTTL